ncbi:D-alanyl-D-alanine carboxypeptidase/D-alanyl-D-alanine endopeptidase [Arthrobacter castelli]|uniref:D-alanyl-D-alanine carboxypeptidase/D-alanyl-D-alanine endopeptidase n=1 Tax=Arthrobacter castelli TaxID=271431 RepID=UPI0004019E1F|nr:D-alanyl-D-alanine carboxypeptidase/D-alanyl-D-alanine-endopeptidase [Arthrobacter castelli]
MRRSGRILTAALLALVLAALAVPLGLYLAPALIDASAPTADDVKTRPPATDPGPDSVADMTSVTGLDRSAPMPDPQVLSKRLETALTTAGPGGFTGVVVDALSGKALYDDGGKQPRVPASNTKLLTAVTALDALGADRRFTTRVVEGKKPGQIVLVGGGDVLLAAGASSPGDVMGHAGLRTLARQTAKSLKQQGVSGEVTVSVDDSLFTGKPARAVWPQGDLATGQVAPIFPMAMYSGRFSPGQRYGNRPQDSALHVGRVFAAALQQAADRQGADHKPGQQAGDEQQADHKADQQSGSAVIKVSDGVGRAEAAAKAKPLAAVQSATVAEQVQLMLETSDNYLAEALGRMAARANGLEASFAGSTRNIVKTISRLGIETDSLRLEDSCGLSSENRISTSQIAAVLRLMVKTEDPDLAAARNGLPVAGLNGTLEERYQKDTQRAAGLVRAKTGTLNEVMALSGYAVTAKGRLLVFSFIGNELGHINPANERALDTAAAVLAGCGCRNAAGG